MSILIKTEISNQLQNTHNFTIHILVQSKQHKLLHLMKSVVKLNGF